MQDLSAQAANLLNRNLERLARDGLGAGGRGDLEGTSAVQGVGVQREAAIRALCEDRPTGLVAAVAQFVGHGGGGASRGGGDGGGGSRCHSRAAGGHSQRVDGDGERLARDGLGARGRGDLEGASAVQGVGGDGEVAVRALCEDRPTVLVAAVAQFVGHGGGGAGGLSGDGCGGVLVSNFQLLNMINIYSENIFI